MGGVTTSFLLFFAYLLVFQDGRKGRWGNTLQFNSARTSGSLWGDVIFFFSLGVSMTVQSFTASHTVHHTVTFTACICTAFTSFVFCCLQSLTAQLADRTPIPGLHA